MIPLQFPPYALVLICSAGVSIGLSIFALSMKNDKTYTYFGMAFMVIGLWPLLYAIELMIADPRISMSIARYRAVPIQLFPILFMYMVYTIVGYNAPPRWLTVTLVVFAIFQIFIISTSSFLFPIWEKNYVITTKDGFVISVMIPGMWFKFSNVFYHYSTNLIALFLLFKAMRGAKAPFKKQYALLITSIIISFGVAVTFTYGMISYGPYNPIPASFLISASLFAVAIFRYRLLTITPYAKESVFDIITSPVLIIDEHERLIDYNPQARDLLRVSSDMVGTDIRNIFSILNIEWEKLNENQPVIIETRWGTGYNFKFSTIKKEITKDEMKGCIIVFNDITTQLEAMKTLHEKEIITYKESILGDMHDGIGGVVATGTIIAQSALADDDVSEKDRKIAQIASLLENGSFELRSMLNILDKDSLSWETLTYDMRNYSSTVLDSKGVNRKFSISGTSFETDIDFDRYLSIFRLFKEVITNIIKHSQAENVTIELTFSDDAFRIVIHDDGVGFTGGKPIGFGLKNMKNRAEKLKGTVEITSENGTTVDIIIGIK
jgi:signal transduction histidine kinase